jgi:hypothetical protein
VLRQPRRRYLPPACQHLSQYSTEFLVLLHLSAEFYLAFVEEGVYFFVVVAGPEPGDGEMLATHIRRR